MRKTRITSWAAAPLAVWTTLQTSPVWAQAAGLASAASAASGAGTFGLPPRVPYLLIVAIVIVAVIAVLALVLARRALAEVRELKGQLDGMKNR